MKKMKNKHKKNEFKHLSDHEYESKELDQSNPFKHQ